METYYDEIDDDVLVLVADGGLDGHEADELVTRVEHLVDAGLRKLIVDCSKLEVITSAGLGVLLRLHRRMRQHGGDVKVSGVRGMLPQILQVTRLDRLFEMYPDVNRARLAFRPPDRDRPATEQRPGSARDR